MSEAIVYDGKDLEAMSFAVNYHKWILNEFRPYLGEDLVEVGAGTGSFTELILSEHPRSLSAVEPSRMFFQLESRVKGYARSTKIDLYRSIFRAEARTILERQRPDSIIYVNVLEHIEDDGDELKAIYDTLEPRGRCFLFVPALMSLYSEFDRQLGHFRRYSKNELERKCEMSGFKILVSKYFDVVGVVPWFIKYKLLGSVSIASGAVELYDKTVVPIFKHVESSINFPLGKNILLIAEK